MQNPAYKREQVIGYASRTLSKTEQKMGTTEGELSALIFGLKHFSEFLRGGPEFLVRTDHAALTWLKTMNPQQGKLARWLSYIESDFSFVVEHRKGVKHTNADALSRAHASHLSRD